MHQFIHGSDAQYADLERRARAACVVFPGQEMPPGASPPRARVGFEVQPNGTALLLVDRGVSYTGPEDDVRQWLAGGELRFPRFAELRRWVQGPLARCYHQDTLPGPPEQLTDLAAVQANLPQPRGPVYLDEEALYAELARRVRGQGPALRRLAALVSRHLARPAPRRPATIFALGPTGVGKTTAAEALPPALRRLDPEGAAYGYLRLDMAEYQERHRVSQLLGAPPGYIGYADGAALVDALAANPRTVVLFDEIEKAHADVLRALMNAMDAGRLSTSGPAAAGREIDCRPAVFLFTSNLDARGILSDLEAHDAFDRPAAVDEVCRRRLRAAGVAPELIGRIGGFLVFRPLSPETRAEIVTLAVVRVAEEYGLRVAKVAPQVVLRVLEQARGDGFGARPDERLVDELLGNAFARAAAGRVRSPVEVCGGPPFCCLPLPSPAAARGS